ncbi:MAG: hypothetical protein ACFCUN_09430 [Hyphomicrobiaceae bacterium]
MDDSGYDGLSEPERGMVEAIVAGDAADLRGDTVRAGVVRDLLVGAGLATGGAQSAVRLTNGTILGALDLEGAQSERCLLLTNVRVLGQGAQGALILRDARLGRVALSGCDLDSALIADRAALDAGLFIGGGRIGGVVQLRGARISGALAIEGATIGDETSAVLGNGLDVSGPFVLRRSTARGTVHLSRARLRAGLHAEALTVTGTGAEDAGALVLEGSVVDGDAILTDATIAGALNCEHATISGRLSAAKLVVRSSGIRAEGLRVGQSVVFDQARVAGSIVLDGCAIAQQLSCEDLDIDGGDIALTARVARIGADAMLSRMRAIGELRLPGAAIRGDLRLSDCRVFGSELAIRAEGAAIEGGWYMERATLIGLVQCQGCRIGNQFCLGGATIKAERGAALIATGSRIARDLQLDQSFNTIGAVVLDHAQVNGRLDLSESRLKSAAIARGTTERATGRPATAVAVIDGREDAGSAELAYDDVALSLVGAEIGHLRMPRRNEQRPRGIVDLSRAMIESYEDWAATWPQRGARAVTLDGRDIDHLRLDGLTYSNLVNPSGLAVGPHSLDDDRIGRVRIAWLEGQCDIDLTEHFKPQPWVHLAERLMAAGHEAAARDIKIVERRRARRAHGMSRVDVWHSRALDWLALYGFNPWRPVAWIAAVVLAFAAIWSFAAGFCAEPGCFDETLLVMTARDGYSEVGLGRGYPAFHALAYSLDVFLPVLDLGYASHWRFNLDYGPLMSIPVPSGSGLVELFLGGEPRALVVSLDVTLGSVFYALTVVERVVGAALTSLAVISFTGLLKPRM